MKHLLIAVFFTASCVSPVFAQAGADDALATLTTAVKAKDYEPALELAKTLVEKNAAREDLAGVLFEAGSAALREKQLAYAAGFYRLLVDQFPKSEHASAARAELVACYTFLRKLDACIAQAKTNLELEPESEWAEYWHFLIAQTPCQRAL
jgi:outer membrane protein assembly factor BamD (BamD/ComL family)